MTIQNTLYRLLRLSLSLNSSPSCFFLPSSSGQCKQADGIEAPGFILLSLPLLGYLIAGTPLSSTTIGHSLLHHRIMAITKLPHWLSLATLGIIETVQNFKWGEVMMVLSYLLMHIPLMASWAKLNYGKV